MLNSFQVNKKTPEQDEKDVGFTVIRVESSVSTEDAEDNKVNADNDAVEEANAAVTLGDNNENDNSEEKEEEAHKEETTSEAPEVSTTSPATDADTTVTTASQQTTTDEDIRFCAFKIPAQSRLCPFILGGLIRSSI